MTTLASYIAQNDATRGAEDGLKNLRLIRDGSQVTIPWVQALVMEGRVFGCGVGATALGVAAGTFGAGAIDTDELDYLQTIPATVAVIPLLIDVNLSAIGTALESGFHAFWGASGVIGANSVAVTPHNLKTNSANASACTVATLGDDGGTTFVPAGLIARRVTTALTGVAGTPQQFLPAWTVANAGCAPVITGLASPARQIAIWATGQASTGYISVQFAELPIADVA